MDTWPAGATASAFVEGQDQRTIERGRIESAGCMAEMVFELHKRRCPTQNLAELPDQNRLAGFLPWRQDSFVGGVKDRTDTGFAHADLLWAIGKSDHGQVGNAGGMLLQTASHRQPRIVT
jgi:hypothetical protein